MGGLQRLTDQIVAGLESEGVRQIAVLPFQDLGGGITELGAFIAEEMTTRLHAGPFEVVERTLLGRILAEHRLAADGLIDEATAKEIGQLLGVDAIATGTLTDLGTEIRVNSRLISTESGSVFSAAAATLLKDDSLESLSSRPLPRAAGIPGASVPSSSPSEGLARGRSLMARAAAAVGSGALRDLKAWREKSVLEATIQGMAMKISIDKTVLLPDRQHKVQELPFGKMTMVVTAEGAWATSPMGSQEMPPAQAAEARDKMKADLVCLLKDHATLACQALEPAEFQGRPCDRVHITGAGGEYVLLFIDPQTHLPAGIQSQSKSPMTQATVTQVMVLSGHEVIGGLNLPRTFSILHDGEEFATGRLEAFEPNPRVDPGLFARPTEGNAAGDDQPSPSGSRSGKR